MYHHLRATIYRHLSCTGPWWGRRGLKGVQRLGYEHDRVRHWFSCWDAGERVPPQLLVVVVVVVLVLLELVLVVLVVLVLVLMVLLLVLLGLVLVVLLLVTRQHKEPQWTPRLPLPFPMRSC